MLKVVLTGVRPGLDPADAHAKLAALFKISADQVAMLLKHPDYVLKAGLDDQTAEKYRRAIESAGGTCRVEPEVTAGDSLDVDLPIGAGSKAGIEPSDSTPARQTLDKASKVIGLDKAGHSKLEKVAGAVIAIALVAFGLAKLYEWSNLGSGAAHGSSSSKQGPAATGGAESGYLMPAAKVEAADLAKATDTRLPESMPIMSWQDQGYGFSQRTRIYFLTDTFGKIGKVYVEQLGVRTSTGQVHPIPKFALKYHADAAQGGDILIFASLNGPGSPVRLSFDQSPEYVELMPNSGEYVTGKMGGKVAEGMKAAGILKVLHGASAAGGELAFQYDLAELRKAIAFALAALGTTPSESASPATVPMPAPASPDKHPSIVPAAGSKPDDVVVRQGVAGALRSALPMNARLDDWERQGYRVSGSVRVFVWLGPDGKAGRCRVDQLGVDPGSGRLHEEPMTALMYHVSATANEIILVSAFDPGKPMRMVFDSDSTPFDMVNPSTRAVSANLEGRLERAIAQAGSVRVQHIPDGGKPNAELVYDLAAFREGMAIAVGACR